MMRTAVNRVLLGVLGLALAGTGAWFAVSGFAEERLPGWWRGPSPRSRLLERERWADLQARGWWDTAVIGALALLVLLLLWWFFAQAATGRRRVLHLPRPWLRLRTRALASAVAEELERHPGVAAGSVRIGGGRRGRLRVRVTLHLSAQGQPGPLLGELAAGPLENLRRATGAEELDSAVRLRHGSRRAARVR
ncbi:hypothetical protein SLNWT_7275 [Streptomyces albus]|uniref:Alkaline shock response membrane anchor protein AmaP n=1 Tax=Streptomyces albus (strain ATCC 21838 / DSM 41398 / FERM P-419 / JCM 4703 / NBRC 107858) TaxID=1081613 RepID=A0A0B5F9W7_STRA4|nr:hypothetical protein SLNWT_7275 [Streptomyces albus]AOU81951.1 hypothetical protein SLNHY_7260 [Streptomyces albus]AYN37636.1 hypothetical protein DUI70_7143 [Streptomyces albus]